MKKIKVTIEPAQGLTEMSVMKIDGKIQIRWIPF